MIYVYTLFRKRSEHRKQIFELMFFVFVAVAVLVSAQAEHVKMESMITRDNFVKKSLADKTQKHQVVFAVKQNGIDDLESFLESTSDPTKKSGQAWLTFDQVNEKTKNAKGFKTVTSYLKARGLTATWSKNQQHYLTATATVAEWEALFDTKFYQFEDRSGSNGEVKTYLRALQYSLPEELQPHVTAVFNTVQVPPSLSKRTLRKAAKQGELQSFKTNLRVNAAAVAAKSAAMQSTLTTTTPVTVSFLETLYAIPANVGNPLHNQSVFETASEYYSPADLAAFQAMYGLPNHPAEDVGGGVTATCSTTGSGDSCNQGNLDIQYISGIGQATTSIYWYVDSSSGADPFVTWITDVADTKYPPQSNSISWGENEALVSTSVMQSFNCEALKLAVMGVTVVVSAGDNGVAGASCSVCNPSLPATATNCPCSANSGSGSSTRWKGANAWTGTGYFPSFPATSMFVTAVGATQGPNAGSAEIACQASLGGVATTGGGFSSFFPQPLWQRKAVATYWTRLTATTIPTPGFNRKGRAYPDVSLIGVDYQVVIAGALNSLYGTSASAPVFAAMISLVNGQRLHAGMPSVGFVNPWLYYAGARNPLTFNDVTSGANKCCASSTTTPTCCAAGFTAAAGWDPLTGWGSIKYQALYDIFPQSPPPPRPSSLSPMHSPVTLSPAHTPVPITKSPEHTPLPYHLPTKAPSAAPIETPTAGPSSSPVFSPSFKPSVAPSAAPSAGPSAAPSVEPSAGPTYLPSALPTGLPFELPTAAPSAAPVVDPSAAPSQAPFAAPTADPSGSPVAVPAVPSSQPVSAPTLSPVPPQPSDDAPAPSDDAA